MFAASNDFTVTPSCSINVSSFQCLKDETAASFSGVHMRVNINAIDKLTSVHLARRKLQEAGWEVG